MRCWGKKSAKFSGNGENRAKLAENCAFCWGVLNGKNKRIKGG